MQHERLPPPSVGQQLPASAEHAGYAEHSAGAAGGGGDGDGGGGDGDGGGGDGGGGEGSGDGAPHVVPNAVPQTHTPWTQSEVPSHAKPGQEEGAHTMLAATPGQVMLPVRSDPDGGATFAPADGHVSHKLPPPCRLTSTSRSPAALHRVA